VIDYRFAREKELLLEYAGRLGAAEAEAILTRGTIANAAEARTLARFYWRMVDASLDDPIEPWLERIHTTLFIALGNAGYGDIWDAEVPAE
jgi:hypothetical protein